MIKEKKAGNLIDAYNNFNEKLPVSFTSVKGVPKSGFYIDREGNPTSKLKFDLLTSHEHDKILFTGHMGSGKSSELNRLAADPKIQNKFFIVKYSVNEVLDINNLNYIDLLVSIGAIAFTRAVKEKLKLSQGLLERLDAWQGTLEKEDIIVKEKNLGLSLKVSKFFFSLMGGVKRSHTIREHVRVKIEPKLSELKEIINNIILEINASLKSGKEILILIDDLEKIPRLENAKELFCNNLFLKEPVCKIIYTVPIALLYSTAVQQAINNLGISYTLPNVRLTDKEDSKKAANGYNIMRKFVFKRMKEDLIDKKALDEAVKNSGGVIRGLTRIMRGACRNASLRNSDIIAFNDVRESVVDIRNDFDRMLGKEHVAKLKEVAKNKQLSGEDDLSLSLLHSLSVLEYKNHARWCDVNPIIRPLLDRR